MNTRPHERGQALILIVFAIVGLVGITALAVDGGMAYSDRRSAQNAADSAALAAALLNIRGGNVTNTALHAAAVDGYNNNQTTNWVTVTVLPLPMGACKDTPNGKDIKVDIKSTIRTYFAPVLGIRQVTNVVSATARSCEPYTGPLFNGDAIIALGKTGVGFNGVGTADWSVTGGGIFSNSSDSPSARCKGNTTLDAPSLTTVGTTDIKCDATIGQQSTGAAQLNYADYSAFLPRIPECKGTAQKQGNYWVVDSNPNADGSKVAFNGDMQFGPGLFCVTNSPGPYHNQITGTGVTFYLMPANFSIKLNGGGGLGTPLTPSTIGEYAGILMFSKPQLDSNGDLINTQNIDLRGNGNAAVEGSIILPSASITMFGNSNSSGYQTQVIGYNVDSGGNASININYNATGGYQATFPAWLTLLR